MENVTVRLQKVLIRRIGGLEKSVAVGAVSCHLIRRIGGLEIELIGIRCNLNLIRRIGGLEM